MALGTLDHTPPPFFRQGLSALTKLSFCSALALFLMVADARFRLTQPLRASVAALLYPLQRTLLMPVEALSGGRDYFSGLAHAVAAEQPRAARWSACRSERCAPTSCSRKTSGCGRCSELRPALAVRSQPAELLYEAADPYSRKVIIDRGVTHNVVAGSPVVNEAGVPRPGDARLPAVGGSDAAQRSRRGHSGPEQPHPGAQRGLRRRRGRAGLLEMRFMAGNADVQVGDVLTTSGVDGVYPPGLKVARVVAVDRKADSGFARIVLAPAAQADGVRHVLVLEPTGVQMPVRPQAAASEPASSAKGAGKKAARK